MKIVNYIVAFATTITVFSGCKDAGAKPAIDNSEAKTVKKETAVALKPETASFRIDGMTCAIGCAGTIQKKLSEMDGVQKATVDFDKKQATVEFDAAVLTPEKLTKAVETTGDGETYKVSQMKTKGKV
ncbi:MAG TPA: heavy metal-associated domain-containing protein [Flavobacterium sp.]|uniref:heavy-metal-associated domain-containing protein n=1 Tax=Flavobacterium sp. TaxID=239 RepID=UPI002BB88691|nr:heavy metal-associated domain-containing protein [Flavobacterium sp.]HNP31693.1 heavy metal-associated domain-containing protein [Flavobacterium sp.]